MMAVRKAPQECAPGMSLCCTHFPAPAFVYTLNISPCACPCISVPVCLFLYVCSFSCPSLHSTATSSSSRYAPVYSCCITLLFSCTHSFLLWAILLLTPCPPLPLPPSPSSSSVVHRVHMYGVPPRSPSTAPHGWHTGEKVRTYVPPAMSCHVMSSIVIYCPVVSYLASRWLAISTTSLTLLWH